MANEAETVLEAAGRDISVLLSPERERQQALSGFDAGYADIVHYILSITHAIWEGKRLDLIAQTYAQDCWLLTNAGIVKGKEAVIANTAATLGQFPDRTLYGDDVIWGGDDKAGFYTSHRITSHMSHLGRGDFGAPTGRRVTVATIADCVVRENAIHDEWLVRDNAGLALQLGLDPVEHAARQAAADRDEPAEHFHWRTAEVERVRDGQGAETTGHDAGGWPRAFAQEVLDTLVNARAFGAVSHYYWPQATWIGPSNRRLVGHGEIAGHWASLIAALPDARMVLDHVAAIRDSEGHTRIAVRWSLAGTHHNAGMFGAAHGHTLFILGVSHWRLVQGRILEDRTVYDELAVLRQALGGLGAA